MKILVTGSSGYIGSSVAAELRECGLEVYPCDVREGRDLCEPETREWVADLRPEVVFNFAGISGRAACEADPAAAEAVNGDLPLELYDAARPRIFVQASTCSLYQAGEQDAYTRTKDLGEVWEAGWINLRLGTVFGVPLRHTLADRIRWDLPLHRMVETAVTEGRIFVPPRKLWRPWLYLQDLVRICSRLACLVAQGAQPSGGTEMPLVSTNRTLQDMAVLVALVTDAMIEEGPETDARDYTALEIGRAGDKLEKDIQRLVEVRRERATV